MFIKKTSLFFLLGFASLFLLFGFFENTKAAIGDACNKSDGVLCEDGQNYCYDSVCKMVFPATLGETCAPNDYLKEGMPCADGSLCFNEVCKKQCDSITFNYGLLCDEYDRSKGRCYPTKSKPQISVCETQDPLNEIDSSCGIVPGSYCKKITYDLSTGKATCGSEDLIEAWQGTLCDGTSDMQNALICCEPKTERGIPDYPCPGLPFGERCSGSYDYYCYDGMCKYKEGARDGEPCGTLGGICQEKPSLLDSSLWKDTTNGGRSCEEDLECYIKVKDAYKNYGIDVCKFQKDGEYCGNIGGVGVANAGFCFNEKCEYERAEINEPCGRDDLIGVCKNSCGNKETRIRSARFCEDPLACCLSSDTENGGTSTPKKLDLSGLRPEYQTCTGEQPDEGTPGWFNPFKGSIVPCGRSCDDANTTGNEMSECTACHFIIMGKRVYDLVFSLLLIVSFLMLTVGGILYMISGANPNLNSNAKEIIKKTLIGFALFLGSWLIVNTVLLLLSVRMDKLGTGANWFDFTCDTTSSFQLEYKPGHKPPAGVDF